MREVKQTERAASHLGRAAPAAPNRRLAPPTSRPAPSSARCACGGGCPRCASSGLRATTPGDPLEQEADRLGSLLVDDARPGLAASGSADRSRLPAALELAAAARLGTGVQPRIHTGPAAHRLAVSLGARAFTFGPDIAFREGEFQPHTERGRRLIAHEMVHVAQQSQAGAPIVQRQPDVVNMPPLTVTSTLNPVDQTVSDLDRLTGEGVDPAVVSMAHDPAVVARNSPAHATQLPFSGSSWDAPAILRLLGQYDTMPGTDSDAVRCVQAVALASRIVDGPAGVTGFLRAMILEGMLSRAPTPRQQTAIEVLEHVIGRIDMRRATFGDLMWAQESLHDLFYNDVSGTPDTEILARMAPGLELGRSLTRMDVWCNTPADVIAAAAGLQPGEQLLVNTWQIAFNEAFEQLEQQGIQTPVGGTRVVDVNGVPRRLRHIDSSVRPPHTSIDLFRDSKSGHQLLVMKDGATGQLRLYEPEVTGSGRHLEDLAPDGSNFTRYFRDLPDIQIYNYIQILGKLTPGALATSTWPTP
jgi:hypothetical protein